MYYCTEHGKVKGQLQISQSRIFFDPQECEENKNHGPKNMLKKFEVCIDMGDVISVSKKTLVNESGSYVSDPDGLKSYMYDFFLQIDLAAVTRKINEDPFEEDKNQGVQALDQPSFINSCIGESFSDNDNSYIQQHDNFKDFMQNHALTSLSKARPVATVFFRFSHRNEHDDFLTVNEQKIIVSTTRTIILDCQKKHALRLVELCMGNRIEDVKNSISQTSL